MEKQYPYLSEDGKTIHLAPGFATETKEEWEKREQLPPPPESICISPFTQEEVENVRDLVVYDVTNMTQEEFDAFLAPYLK